MTADAARDDAYVVTPNDDGPDCRAVSCTPYPRPVAGHPQLAILQPEVLGHKNTAPRQAVMMPTMLCLSTRHKQDSAKRRQKDGPQHVLAHPAFVADQLQRLPGMLQFAQHVA